MDSQEESAGDIFFIKNTVRRGGHTVDVLGLNLTPCGLGAIALRSSKRNKGNRHKMIARSREERI